MKFGKQVNLMNDWKLVQVNFNFLKSLATPWQGIFLFYFDDVGCVDKFSLWLATWQLWFKNVFLDPAPSSDGFSDGIDPQQWHIGLLSVWSFWMLVDLKMHLYGREGKSVLIWKYPMGTLFPHFVVLWWGRWISVA